MSTVTPNFNWPVPTSTDLVKDGATAIEALGDSIDASLVDLKGGTTGQVLSKTSNTDMDFTWVAADDTNAIQNTIVDAKGDLIAASAADTPARLAVGSNGETLVADSSTSTGLRYTAGTVQSNPVLNSAMQVWQRGTSFALGNGVQTYTADRWCAQRNATGSTISRQATGDTTNLPFIQYGLRIQRDSGNTSTQLIAASQSFESVNSIPFAGKTITVSFYAKAGANYSSASSLFKMQVYSGTGTDQNVLNGLTGGAVVIDGNATLTTTYQRFSFTGTVAATATQLAIYSFYTPVGTAGANDWAEITGVQFDVGSVALPYRTNGATLQGETSACLRYFWKADSFNTAVYGVGACADATNHYAFGYFPALMRVSPTATATAASTFYVTAPGVANVDSTAISLSTIKTNSYRIYSSTASNAAFAQGRSIVIENKANSAIEWSAEL